MKNFYIVDKVSKKPIQDTSFNSLIIAANNGKQALQKFIRNNYMRCEIYDYHKDLFTREWSCSTIYGSCFKAIEA